MLVLEVFFVMFCCDMFDSVVFAFGLIVILSFFFTVYMHSSSCNCSCTFLRFSYYKIQQIVTLLSDTSRQSLLNSAFPQTAESKRFQAVLNWLDSVDVSRSLKASRMNQLSSIRGLPSPEKELRGQKRAFRGIFSLTKSRLTAERIPNRI